MLSYAKSSRPFILTCDASDLAISYILGQKDENGREYVIAYGGKTLTEEERKWSTSDKECYAIIRGIQPYRPYLAGTHFTIATDHRALNWLQSAKHTGRLERWALKIQYLNFEIVQRPGKSNVVADCLSRRAYPEPPPSVNTLSFENDDLSQKTQWVTEVTYFYDHDDTEDPSTSAQRDGTTLDNALHDDISLAKLQQTCPDLQDIYAYLSDKTLPNDEKASRRIVIESESYTILQGVLYHWYQRRYRKVRKELRHIQQIALPKVLRMDALKSYHDSLAGSGHLGIDKVRSSLLQKYWWNTMHGDIVEYIKSCDRCQRAKRNYDPSKRPCSPMPQVGRFERWHIDILGPLYKTSEGYEYIHLVVDAFSR